MGWDRGKEGGKEGERPCCRANSLSVYLFPFIPGHLIAVHVDDRVGDHDLGGHGWDRMEEEEEKEKR